MLVFDIKIKVPGDPCLASLVSGLDMAIKSIISGMEICCIRSDIKQMTPSICHQDQIFSLVVTGDLPGQRFDLTLDSGPAQLKLHDALHLILAKRHQVVLGEQVQVVVLVQQPDIDIGCNSLSLRSLRFFSVIRFCLVVVSSIYRFSSGR